MADDLHVDEIVRLLFVDEPDDAAAVRDLDDARASLVAYIAREALDATGLAAGATSAAASRGSTGRPRRPWVLVLGVALALLLVGGATAATLVKLFHDDDTASAQVAAVNSTDTPLVTLPSRLLDELRGPVDPTGTDPDTGRLGAGAARRLLDVSRPGLDATIDAVATEDGRVCAQFDYARTSGAEMRAMGTCVARFTADQPIVFGAGGSVDWHVYGIQADAVQQVRVRVGADLLPVTDGRNAFFATGPGPEWPDELVVTLTDGSVVHLPIWPKKDGL